MKITIEDVHLGPTTFDPHDVGLLVCDIDGTIADNSHRQHWVCTKPKNWSAFEKTMHLDKPIESVLKVVNNFHISGTRIIYCSGRGEQNRELTLKWLRQVKAPEAPLFMRKIADYRRDDIIKAELMSDIIFATGQKPGLILEDRNQVVALWRRLGYTCIQVAEGDF